LRKRAESAETRNPFVWNINQLSKKQIAICQEFYNSIRIFELTSVSISAAKKSAGQPSSTINLYLQYRSHQISEYSLICEQNPNTIKSTSKETQKNAQEKIHQDGQRPINR
jgi:hypothetical protein